ncbi:MAG: hypothetical protein LBD23_00840 [Oscillospiraceae bacterium]|jgi:hypothetical protein|nr:hypothetical protein [Oscillospiraceae bacterium]
MTKQNFIDMMKAGGFAELDISVALYIFTDEQMQNMYNNNGLSRGEIEVLETAKSKTLGVEENDAGADSKPEKFEMGRLDIRK